jgi:hypothetical protein
VKKKRMCVPTKENMLVQARKILPAVSPICGINPFICQGFEDILSEKKKWENETCESMKWVKGA